MHWQSLASASQPIFCFCVLLIKYRYHKARLQCGTISTLVTVPPLQLIAFPRVTAPESCQSWLCPVCRSRRYRPVAGYCRIRYNCQCLKTERTAVDRQRDITAAGYFYIRQRGIRRVGYLSGRCQRRFGIAGGKKRNGLQLNTSFAVPKFRICSSQSTRSCRLPCSNCSRRNCPPVWHMPHCRKASLRQRHGLPRCLCNRRCR